MSASKTFSVKESYRQSPNPLKLTMIHVYIYQSFNYLDTEKSTTLDLDIATRVVLPHKCHPCHLHFFLHQVESFAVDSEPTRKVAQNRMLVPLSSTGPSAPCPGQAAALPLILRGRFLFFVLTLWRSSISI